MNMASGGVEHDYIQDLKDLKQKVYNKRQLYIRERASRDEGGNVAECLDRIIAELTNFLNYLEDCMLIFPSLDPEEAREEFGGVNSRLEYVNPYLDFILPCESLPSPRIENHPGRYYPVKGRPYTPPAKLRAMPLDLRTISWLVVGFSILWLIAAVLR